MRFHVEILFFLCEVLLFAILNQKFRKPSNLSVLMKRICSLDINFFLRDRDVKKTIGSDEKYISSLIEDAHFAGYSTHTNMRKLYNELNKAHKTANELAQLNLVMCGRILILSFIALTTRYACQMTKSLSLDASLIPYDFICLIMSLSCFLIFLVFLNFYYPKSWFWHLRFSKEAEDWLKALFLKQIDETSPIYQLWQNFEEIELSSGLSQSKQKKILIDMWSFQSGLKMRQKEALFRDYLPLLECLFLGSSVSFILAIPLWQMLHAH